MHPLVFQRRKRRLGRGAVPAIAVGAALMTLLITQAWNDPADDCIQHGGVCMAGGSCDQRYVMSEGLSCSGTLAACCLPGKCTDNGGTCPRALRLASRHEAA